jgi:hypothetical protein
MAENIDDITISYTEDGKEVTKELDKVVLTRGAWSTIVFKYQSWNNSKQEYGPIAYSIRRYQKRNGVYMQKSKFNISNKEQAQKVIDTLSKWVVED